MIKEYLAKKALDVSLEAAKRLLRETNNNLLITRDDIEESLVHHLQSVTNWSSEVHFSDLKKAKRTTKIFIELDLYVYPRRRRIQRNENIEKVPLRSIFRNNTRHFVLLGHPGAGKTTSMMYLCQTLLHDERFYSDRFSFPILIRFRDLNGSVIEPHSSVIIDEIYRILGLKVDFPEDKLKTRKNKDKGKLAAEIKATKMKLVVKMLEELKVLLILDGFDELGQAELQEESIKEVRYLALHLTRSTLILTSRTGEFIYNIENTDQYEISSLGKEQISTFALKWLSDKKIATDFLTKIYESPFADTAIRPLTLAHLCAIYERIGEIPDKPKTIYRKIIDLLLEEWDQQRSVKRVSRYARFGIDRKREFLCHLAFELTTTLRRAVFTREALLKAYRLIYEDYDLRIAETQQVVNELETHTGLFVQTGYEEYEFAHKSLQEYLTAEHIVRLPSIPKSQTTLFELPNEFAIAVTISSRPSDYLMELILSRLMMYELRENFLKTFFSRLLLEKPNFNSSSELGISLLILYTKYIGTLMHTSSQLSTIDFSLTNEFEKIIDQAISRSALEVIRSYYVPAVIHEKSDGNNIHVMTLVQSGQSDRLPTIGIELPGKLYIRQSALIAASEKSKSEDIEDKMPY